MFDECFKSVSGFFSGSIQGLFQRSIKGVIGCFKGFLRTLQGFLGAKAPLGLAHVKKKKDRGWKSFRIS